MKKQPSQPFGRFLFVNDLRWLFEDGRSFLAFKKCGIIYCRTGSIEICLENRRYRIAPGDVYIHAFPSLTHFLFRSGDAGGVMVELDWEYLLPLLHRVLSVEDQLSLWKSPVVSLSEGQRARLEFLLGDLTDRLDAEETSSPRGNDRNRNLQQELVRSMGQVLCYEFLSMYFANRPQRPLRQDKKDLIVYKFTLALLRYHGREREVAFYAGKQCLTRRYFSTIIKEKTGESALQWIVKKVITEAKHMLEESDLSVKEIAMQLNFPTQSFFGKYFKQYTGMSPTEYRNGVSWESRAT